jgi:hypothetical protein
MSRLGLAVHRFRPDALEVAGRVIGWASANGYEVVADESDLASLRAQPLSLVVTLVMLMCWCLSAAMAPCFGLFMY